ncbi:Kinesin heavy chain [Diplonema papillatum]|nr:Kinesin heavy chain [Diplonema papillatum]
MSDKKKREAKTIQVFLRLRPPNKGELERNEKCDVVHIEQDKMVKLGENPHSYSFNRIFGMDSKQDDVFTSVAKKAVEDSFEGYHGLIFCYGQTGTGKTFTMSNQTPGQEGMMQRSVAYVFDKIAADTSGDYEVHVSFIQIYQEVIQDLLDDSKESQKDKKGIAIRDDPDVEGGVYLSPIKMVTAYSAGMAPKEGTKKVLQQFHKGDSQRSVASTAMNAQSSRSHTVFTLYIARRNKMTDQDYEDDGVNKQEFKGRLILVDLAGCERQKKTGASGDTLQQANAINGSLLVLGKCIKALTDPRQFVPYRESKLTRLLQYSLAGHGKTTIVVTCGPSERNLDETRGAIEFGQRAMTIKQEAKKHVEIDYKALCKKLQAQLDARGDYQNEQLLNEVKSDYEEIIAQKTERIKFLEAELALYTSGEKIGDADSDEETPPARAGYSSSAAGGGAKKSTDRKVTKDTAGGKEKFKLQMKDLEDRLEQKGSEMQKYKKEKLALQRENNVLEDELHQVRHQMNLLGMKTKAIITEKDDQLQRMQKALMKLKRGDYVSPTASLEREDNDASPRPEGMTDGDYINKLQFGIRKMVEREAVMAAYYEKARDAICYQATKADELKGKVCIAYFPTYNYSNRDCPILICML